MDSAWESQLPPSSPHMRREIFRCSRASQIKATRSTKVVNQHFEMPLRGAGPLCEKDQRRFQVSIKKDHSGRIRERGSARAGAMPAGRQPRLRLAGD